VVGDGQILSVAVNSYHRVSGNLIVGFIYIYIMFNLLVRVDYASELILTVTLTR
jgi:hypothetical protein